VDNFSHESFCTNVSVRENERKWFEKGLSELSCGEKWWSIRRSPEFTLLPVPLMGNNLIIFKIS